MGRARGCRQRLKRGSEGRLPAVFAGGGPTLAPMKLTIRHRFWGGVEIVDERGEVLAEAETAEDAVALLPALEAEKKPRRESGLLDLIFGS